MYVRVSVCLCVCVYSEILLNIVLRMCDDI